MQGAERAQSMPSAVAALFMCMAPDILFIVPWQQPISGTRGCLVVAGPRASLSAQVDALRAQSQPTDPDPDPDTYASSRALGRLGDWALGRLDPCDRPSHAD